MKTLNTAALAEPIVRLTGRKTLTKADIQALFREYEEHHIAVKPATRKPRRGK